MESILHTEFLRLRGNGKAINRKWFSRRGKMIFSEQYPELVIHVPSIQVQFEDNLPEQITNIRSVPLCWFSNGWFEGFCKRMQVSWRAKTSTSEESPEDKIQQITLFLQFIRRNSQLNLLSMNSLLYNATIPQIMTAGRFLPQAIFNMDQTSLPFEFLSGRTYDSVGNKRV